MIDGYDEKPTPFDKCMDVILDALAIVGCVSLIIAICCLVGYVSV